MAHQIGINVEKTVSLDRLSEGLRNSLKARLTLTMIKDRYYDEIDGLILGGNLSDIEEFSKNINAILDEYTYKIHPCTKSSLLLSAFSICEGYLSNKIRQTLKLQEFDNNNEIISFDDSNKRQVDIEVLDLLNSFKSYAMDLEKQINNS